MTLKYMQGFETMLDDSDFRAQGWVTSPGGTRRVVAVPSVTSVSGRSLALVGAGSAGGTTLPGASGAIDPGYLNLGVTVNQAWQAGGFSYGFAARFNSGTAAAYASGASGTTPNASGICFDGTQYWALRVIGSTYAVVTSPDLITWTPTSNQPGALSALSTLSYMGGGVVMCVLGGTSTAANVYYTTNGSTWSTQNLGTLTSGTVTGIGASTGNATYPHIVCIGSSVAGTSGGIYIGTLGGTMTQVVTRTVATGFTGHIRTFGGLLVVASNQGGTLYSATASNSALNTAGAWSTATFTALSGVTDVCYHSAGNVWALAHSAGISTIPNTGAVGTPVAPSGAVTVTSRYTTAQILGLYYTTTSATYGSTSQGVGVGVQGHIVSSTDGITWNELGSHLLPVGTAGSDWRSSIYDGTRYVVCSDATNGIVATSADLVNNWNATYVQDVAESASSIYSTTGVWAAAVAPSSGSTFTTYRCLAFAPSATVTSGNRPVFFVANPTGSTLGSQTLTNDTTVHYYECVATAVPGTANSFTAKFYVDGQLAFDSGSTSYALGANSTDTASLLIFNFTRYNSWMRFDDIYFCTNDGLGVSGPQGAVNIIARRPTTDVQAKWTKVGSAVSNAKSVSQTLSAQSSNYLTSNTPGDKDIYSSTDTVPVGFAIKALQLEGVFTKTSTAVPTVNLGLISSGTEVDGASVQLSSSNATYITQVVEKDPKTNAAWTNSGVAAHQWAVNHSS